jgi:secreted trypsin-like serine protease
MSEMSILFGAACWPSILCGLLDGKLPDVKMDDLNPYAPSFSRELDDDSITVPLPTLASSDAFFCGANPSAFSSKVSRGSHIFNPQNLDHQLPSTVKLRMVYEYETHYEIDHCGGTVIDSQWIVTAAHCVSPPGDKWDRIEVIAGDTNLDGSEVVHRVTKQAICHSGFEYKGLKDDIALIRLDEPLPKEIVPALLDEHLNTSAVEKNIAIVAGWPVTGRHAGKRELNKTYVSMPDVTVPGYITAVTAENINEGVCQGESGGPIMAHVPDTVVGLQLAGVLSGTQPGIKNSKGEGCMLDGYEMYFTPIAPFREWIDNVRNICTIDSSLCKGSGAVTKLLKDAPKYNAPKRGPVYIPLTF